jgi:hypothetical protein
MDAVVHGALVILDQLIETFGFIGTILFLLLTTSVAIHMADAMGSLL